MDPKPTAGSPPAGVAAPAIDPYVIDADGIKEPPTTLRGRLRYLGPGLVLSASVVGSGELITTTSLGAKAGFFLFWLVIVSTGIKVWVQMELATWAILRARPALEGFATVPPRLGRIGWINVLWLLMDTAKFLQRGGIIGGTAAACSILLPLVGESLSLSSLATWTVISIAIVLFMLRTSRYGVVEKTCVAAVALFTLTTVGLALGLPLTSFAYTGGDIASGLTFSIPAGTLGYAIAMFGITGVGADEMTTYTYWCLEKGYARWTGPDDGSDARAWRAEGWLRVMRLDVFISWLVCTVCTLSFYVIGAAVLHPQGLVPDGNQLITALSHMYTDTLGAWAEYVFLIGAIAVLFSTFIAASASVPRLWTNSLALLGLLDWRDQVARQRTIRILTMLMPPIWGLCFLTVQSPLLMVQIGGVASGTFLLGVVVAVWYLRTKEVDRRFRSNTLLTGALCAFQRRRGRTRQLHAARHPRTGSRCVSAAAPTDSELRRIPAMPTPARRPNIVYLVLDDLGFADLGCYGSEIATPAIDRLAANGLRYTNFHTTAMCAPTRAALLTGRQSHAVGMGIIPEWRSDDAGGTTRSSPGLPGSERSTAPG